MLGKEDVDRIIEAAMRNLSVDVEPGIWLDPNLRTIVLKYNGTEISRTDINLTQT